MIRSELLAELHKDNPELRADEVEQVVDIFFDEIAQRLAEGGRVELRGFGAFSTRERDARSGRNPRTGEAVAVPSKRVPYFKAGKVIRERLNDYGGALRGHFAPLPSCVGGGGWASDAR